MKMCQAHWDELKEAVRAKGLYHLVASSGQAAMERAIAEVKGDATLSNYDPLMAANWMICGRAIDLGGLYLLGSKENGEPYCPLCELNEQVEKQNANTTGKIPATVWIEGAVDEQWKYCQENGLKSIETK